MRRRSLRRLGLVLALLATALACELEVIGAARELAPRVPWPWLSLFLTWGFPVAASVLALGPVLIVSSTILGRRLNGAVLSFYIAPGVLFVLTCAAHAALGGLMLMLHGPFTPLWSGIGLTLPFLLALYGATLGQLWTRVERVTVPMPGLGRPLRVAQLSDLHAGGLVGAGRLQRLMDLVQEQKPDLVVVTGDIVNSSPREAEAVGPLLGRIQAPLGVWACMGNHDHFVDGDAVAAVLEKHGVKVLRNEGRLVEHEGTRLFVCGADDTWTGLADVALAVSQRPAGVPVLLLAHDPNLWPQAVAQHVELTLSGHTHGGQVGLVALHPSISMARLISPFVAGGYDKDGSHLHVSRGSANTLPIRLGVPTEVGLFELVDPTLA